MRLDKQSARELTEAVEWWEDQMAKAWNATLGHIFGYQPLHKAEPTVVLVEEDAEE